MENRHLEVSISDSNNKEINNIKYNYTEYSNTYPITSYHKNLKRDESDMIDMVKKREEYKRCICDNIDYPMLVSEYSKEEIDGVVDIMTDAVCSRNKCLIVGCDEIPQSIVKGRLLKLDFNHIEYVLDCLKKNVSKIRNVKKYLLAALYNSYSTMEHYYRAEVNYDLHSSV